MKENEKEMIEREKWILVAGDWFGFCRYDEPILAKYMLSDWSNFKSIPDGINQGMLNVAMTIKLLKTSHFLNHESVMAGGTPLIDQNRIGYWGNSLGGILGGGYLARSHHIPRGVLGVPGAPLSLILTRSRDFGDWHTVLTKLVFFNWRSVRMSLVLAQMLWDNAESSGWLTEMVRKNKLVLFHDALGDAEVTPLAAQLMARAYNCSTVVPETRSIFGVSEKVAPFVGSAIVEWKYDDTPPVPDQDIPPTGKNTHECPRRMREAQNQIKKFLEEGLIEQYCSGICEKAVCPF